MAVDLNLFQPLLKLLTKDARITVWHLATMLAIFQLATSDDLSAPIHISRKRVMQLSHINSFMTYHKCIKELQEFGYFTYHPSYHPSIGSKIVLDYSVS